MGLEMGAPRTSARQGHHLETISGGREREAQLPSFPNGPFVERELGLLREVALAFDGLGVASWLDQGTLLGVVRGGRLLAWDHDIDLGAWHEQVTFCEPELAAALRERLSGKAEVVWGQRTIGVNPLQEGACLPVNIGLYEREGDQAVKWFGRPPESIPLHRRILRAVLAEIVRPVLIRPSSRLLCLVAESGLAGGSPPLRRAATKMASAMLHIKDRGRDAVASPIKTSVDARFFDRLEPIKLRDVSLAIPNDAETYLALKYGDDWRVPRRTWCYWKEDGAIVHGLRTV